MSTGLDAGDWGRGGVCSCGAGVGMGTVAATGVGIEADTRVGHIFYSQKRLFLYFLSLLFSGMGAGMGNEPVWADHRAWKAAVVR